eukprot:403353220
MFPKALEMRIFNTSPSVGHSNKNSLELKECVRLQKDQHDYFEMTGNIKIQLFKEPKKDESLNLAFNVSLYTTESFELSQECAVPSQSLVKSQTQIKQGWNVIVQNQLKNRTLTCTKDNNLLYKCMDVPILKGDVQDIMQNNLFHVFVDHSQHNFEVQELEIILKKRNIEHTKSLTFMKYVFVFATLLATILYYKSISHFQMEDLGLIQKWVFVLLVQLLFFDDPFYSMRSLFPYNSYSIIYSFSQATFLAMILFFWLVVVHSISSNEIINIDEKRFYLPKIILCLGIWVVLMISNTYLNLQQINDPSFYWRDDVGSFYSSLQICSVVLFLLYSSYFVIVAYVAFFQIKEMKKSYKFSLYMTFGVILFCISIMLFNGYRQTQNDTVMFVAFYAMFNIYMFIIAYLYSPSVDSLEDLQYKQTRKEHEHIMNQFYEQELPDISKDLDSSRQSLTNDRKKKASNGSAEKRRHLKKDPAQKAKDKLWESIIKETEDEDDSSSDDEHQI